VIGSHNICLDILDVSQKQIYQGWTSGYTVEAILIQLQSFLFTDFVAVSSKTVLSSLQKQNVQTANAFRCSNPECNHQGPIKPYPPFNDKEKDKASFLMIKTADNLLEEELVCFHTR
jgi:hypothetical protein